MADITLTVGGDVRSLEKEIDRLSRKKINPMGGKGGGFSNPLGRITGQLGEFEKALDASNARVLAFGASAGALVAVTKGLKAIVDASIDVEKKMADINVILNASSKNLDKFSNSLFGVAKNTASSFQDVTEAATELARQGLTVEETLKRTSDSLILVRLSGMKATDAVEAITAAMNSFAGAALDSSKFVSKLAAVDAAFAVSSKDLAEAVKRVGSSAQEAGLGMDELIAAVTAAQQITARGGAVIGNSFKTIFTRIQRPKVIQELENLGIAVKGLGGTIKPAMGILQELAGVYDTLGASQRAQVAELIGGVFQVNVLKASLRDLGKEFSLYKNALDISNAATDEAARRNEELNKTVAASLNQTVASLTNFGSKIGQVAFGPVIKKVLGGINGAIEES
jgi:TP901 family phage tail tape measure protein